MQFFAAINPAALVLQGYFPCSKRNENILHTDLLKILLYLVETNLAKQATHC